MKGYTEPRIYTPPLRELTEETSLGFAAIQYAKEILHKSLYHWQEWALIHALEIIGEPGRRMEIPIPHAPFSYIAAKWEDGAI